MRLIDDWRWVVRRAWSVRLLAAACFFSGAEVALPVIDQWITIPRGIFAALSGVSTALGFGLRLLAQKRFGDGE